MFCAGYIKFEIPFWVEMAAYSAISLGTLSGGWRIIHTMGSKITRLQPVGGFAAETAGAVSLFTATALGVPVSTTHTITGAIIGRGIDASTVSSPMGHRGSDRLGMGSHHSYLGSDRRGLLFHLLARRLPLASLVR
jgi:phosphate/sulfate permease